MIINVLIFVFIAETGHIIGLDFKLITLARHVLIMMRVMHVQHVGVLGAGLMVNPMHSTYGLVMNQVAVHNSATQGFYRHM